jgi:ABC-type polysaccharide/polyol phosphate export permease
MLDRIIDWFKDRADWQIALMAWAVVLAVAVTAAGIATGSVALAFEVVGKILAVLVTVIILFCAVGLGIIHSLKAIETWEEKQRERRIRIATLTHELRQSRRHHGI